MNFQIAFEKGQSGSNKGLPLGPGLEMLSRAINGLQKGMIYGIAAAPKVGKSTMCDSGFVIGPWLFAMLNNIPIEIIYYSFEIDRISKEFDFAAFFMAYDHNITDVTLPDGITFQGEKVIEMSGDYLLGKLQDDNGDTIKMNPAFVDNLKAVYRDRIIKLFGKYNEAGDMTEKGSMTFIEEKDNPTGIRNGLIQYAELNGSFKTVKFRTKDGKLAARRVGYVPNDPNKYVIIVTDHLRKLLPERGFQMKQTIDKNIEYQVELRNWCKFTFVDIIHLNRDMSDTQRIRMMGDMLYPNSDDIKDTGNLSEEANYVFTMFNPNDDKFNLRKHFGEPIKDAKGNELYPNMRTIHIVESRHTYYPQHFRTIMRGGIKQFKQLNIK